MILNIPSVILEKRAYDSTILIAGIGGGYDVFGGLPIAYEYVHRYNQPDIVLTNYSAVSGNGFGATYYKFPDEGDGPEYELIDAVDWPVYLLPREGVQIVLRGYESILKEHPQISSIFLIDGGVDSLMRGDEEGGGTVLEDAISMAAIAQLPVRRKYLVCLGFGTEIEEGVSHYQALENMAELMQVGAFLGCCSLTTGMECYSFYEETTVKAMEAQKRKSHIHSRVIPAVHGEFGDYKMFKEIDARVVEADRGENFVNPLMAIMWFFDLEKIIERNLLIPKLRLSGTFVDAKMLYRQFIDEVPVRKASVLPIR